MRSMANLIIPMFPKVGSMYKTLYNMNVLIKRNLENAVKSA